MYARVIVEIGVKAVDRLFTYLVPEYLECDMTEFIYKVNQPGMDFYEDDIYHDYEQLSSFERRMLAYLIRTYLEHK